MLRWLAVSSLLFAAAVPVLEIRPLVETAAIPVDVDDPAIWRNPANAAESLVVGTVKRPAPDGGLAVYNLQGALLDRIQNIDRPNNVDILGDLCVTTERLASRLRAYRVSAARPWLTPVGTIPVFEGQAGSDKDPMGIALYRRRRDQAQFAIVSRRTGPSGGYLWQYRLETGPASITASKVRAFGAFSGTGQVEAVAVDQERELVYYSDEDCCVRVYKADPDSPAAAAEVARFATSGFRGNREGIAVAGPWIIVTDQLAQGSEYHVYNRATRKELAVWHGRADSTDGIDAIARPMGPAFPNGFLAAMNSAGHNFHFYPLPPR